MFRFTAVHVVETFVKWRIIPMKQQDAAYTYKGILDPNRESTEGAGPYIEFTFCSGILFITFVSKSILSCCVKSVR